MLGSRASARWRRSDLSRRRRDHHPRRTEPSGLSAEHQSLYKIVATTQIVEMDDPPVEAIRNKPDSSIAVMCKLAAKGEADVVISAGNTGRVRGGGPAANADAARREPAGHRGHSSDLLRPRRDLRRGGQHLPPAAPPPAICDHGGRLCHGRLRHRNSARWPADHRRRRRQGHHDGQGCPQVDAGRAADQFCRQRRRPRPVQRRRRRGGLRRVRRQHRPEIHRRPGRRAVSDNHDGIAGIVPEVAGTSSSR